MYPYGPYRETSAKYREDNASLRYEDFGKDQFRIFCHTKSCSPTSRDIVYNLDTASNPSSSPQFTEDIPSTVLQVEMSSLFEEQDAHDNDTSYIKAPFINALGRQTALTTTIFPQRKWTTFSVSAVHLASSQNLPGRVRTLSTASGTSRRQGPNTIFKPFGI